MRLPPEQKEMLALYAAGMTADRARPWDEALELFRQCLLLWPEDGPSRLMEGRCLRFREQPPPQDWGGMFEHLTK
jgi:adenylate cyclase